MIITKEQLKILTLQEIIAIYPENMPLYLDSGLWQMRSDDMKEEVIGQEINESFKDFLIRCLLACSESTDDRYWRSALVQMTLEQILKNLSFFIEKTPLSPFKKRWIEKIKKDLEKLKK